MCLGQFHLGSWKVREGNSQRSQLLQKFSFWSFSFSNRNCNLASSFHLIKTKLKSRGRILISLVHVCSSALCTSNIWLLIILPHLKIHAPLKHIYPRNNLPLKYIHNYLCSLSPGFWCVHSLDCTRDCWRKPSRSETQKEPYFLRRGHFPRWWI